MESVFKFWKNMERKTRELVPVQVFPAVVKDVKAEERTCTVRVNDNVDLYDVRLHAVTDKDLKGFCLIPKKGSRVLVARIANGNDLYVAMFSEVEQVLGTIGDHTSVILEDEHMQLKTEKVTVEVAKDKVTIDADEVVFNGGKNNGLVKIEEVKKNLDSIKNYVMAMNTAIASGLNGVGAGLKADGTTGASAYNGEMVGKNIEFSDMEDTKVKH